MGLRCTAARMAVLDHVMTATGPKTHAEVAEALSDRGFDRATIYRNLTELTEAKIISRVELGDHVWRFELKRGTTMLRARIIRTSSARAAARCRASTM